MKLLYSYVQMTTTALVFYLNLHPAHVHIYLIGVNDTILPYELNNKTQTCQQFNHMFIISTMQQFTE